MSWIHVLSNNSRRELHAIRRHQLVFVPQRAVMLFEAAPLASAPRRYQRSEYQVRMHGRGRGDEALDQAMAAMLSENWIVDVSDRVRLHHR